MGRPTLYTEDILNTIAARLSRGEPLAAICRDEGMPSDDTVRNWMERDDVGADVSRAIARAREAGEDWLAAECLQIADTPVMGVVEKYEQVEIANPDDPDLPAVKEFQITERKVGDMLDHRKLQIDTRLKLLAKWNPKKWGDRQTIEHDVTGNLAERLKAARERASKR